MLSDPEITERLEEAFARFLSIYSERGAHHFHGWDHADDSRNYYGPMLWSEADCALRLAWELERQFPGMVHLEVPVASWTFADYDSKVDRRQFVDVVVSDLEDFVEDDTSQERFRAHRHMLFVEAKYLPAGCSKTWRHHHIRKIDAAPRRGATVSARGSGPLRRRRGVRRRRRRAVRGERPVGRMAGRRYPARRQPGGAAPKGHARLIL